jgi:hypothetical protein
MLCFLNTFRLGWKFFRPSLFNICPLHDTIWVHMRACMLLFNQKFKQFVLHLLWLIQAFNFVIFVAVILCSSIIFTNYISVFFFFIQHSLIHRCRIFQPTLQSSTPFHKQHILKHIIYSVMLAYKCNIRPLIWCSRIQQYKINYIVLETGVITNYFKLVCSVLWSAILFWWCHQFHIVPTFFLVCL